MSYLNHVFTDWHQKCFVTPTDHDKVIAHIQNEGELTAHYGFMIIISSSIAILGLLLPSPAVVIGAMLISPLMGPIMSLGFSLCILNFEQMKKALGSLVIGIALAVIVSAAIAYVSPLTDATSEITARTQPNLFDLLVAIFSGLAGGYAVIKGKGETIVGVAIATALMPPLAVVGFGLATANPEIYKGALMLFMTNLLAIAFIVTLLAKWYGFGSGHTPKHTVWQIILIFGVFGSLSVPLGLSLKDIAYRTYVTKIAKLAITKVFDEDSKLSLFSTDFSRKDYLSIEAVVLTPSYNATAYQDIKNNLTVGAKTNIKLKLDQIIIAKEKIKEAQQTIVSNEQIKPVAAIPAEMPSLSRLDEMNKALKQVVFFPVRSTQINTDTNQIIIYPKNDNGLSLTLLHKFETILANKFPDWQVSVIPPAQALPYVFFPRGKAIPTAEGEAVLTDILWALKHWEATEVMVIGRASSYRLLKNFDNGSLANRRAVYVADKVRQAGIHATLKADYQDAKQKQQELTLGSNMFQSAEIRLAQSLSYIKNDPQPDTATLDNTLQTTVVEATQGPAIVTEETTALSE